MEAKIVLFFVSIIIIFTICILIYRQRLGDAGDRRMKGFYPLCIVTLVWTALDAVKLLSAHEYYAYVFVPKVFFASIIPYVSFWFILNFTESKFTNSRLVKILIIAIPALINLMLFTNPLHSLYFENLNYPDPSAGTIPPAGPVFIINIAFITIGFVIFYTILSRYVIKNFRQYPFLIITGIGLLVPFVLYLAFAINLFGLTYDFSPIGFFCTIVLFTYFSYSSRARNYRSKIYSETLVKITKSPKLSAGNLEEAAEMIVKEGCIAIGAHHIGIWSLSGNTIKNTTYYEMRNEKKELQNDVDISNCPEYIEMLRNERLVVINDVNVPNVLSQIINDYNSEVCAILDTPIRINGKLAGVLSVEQHRCEAYPERREWTAEEQNFASSLADLMIIAMESAERRAMTLRTETMMNNLPGMLYQGIRTSSDFTFTFVSEGSTALLGYRPSELINTSIQEFLSKVMQPNDLINLTQQETASFKTGLPFEFIFKGATKSGDEKWIWGRSYVVKQNSDSNMAEGFLTDISERRRLETAELANQAKDRFLAHMSHEMRTPMNALLGIAEIQLLNNAIPEETSKAFEQIYDSGDLLLNIINDILDLSKIEAGKLELTPVNYDMPSLINDTVQLNRLRFESTNVEFALQIDENTPHNLYGDELRIKQILNNLLSNAFKYTEQGTIEFSVSSEPAEDENVMLVFRVSDTGQGMTEEQVTKLFDEYTRFNTDANRETVGTGLGMNIARRLINLMNGLISIESEYGKGSAFTVRIPQKRIGTDVCGADIAKNLRDFRFQSISISKRTQFLREYMPYGSVLVVDDVASNIYVAKGMLSPYSLKIETASNGFIAIDKIKKGGVYDIIFMDHMMPKMDGIETVRIIREMGYKNPIIALTANAIVGRAEMFMKNGFDGFISKPIDSRELNHILNEFIRNNKPPEVVKAARKEQQKKLINTETADQKQDAKDLAKSSEIAELFILDAKNAVKILEDLNKKINEMDKEETKSYITTVHGMKSTLANLGEKELSGIALKLELAGEEGDLAELTNNTPVFIKALQEMMDKYKPVKKSDAVISDIDLNYLREKLNNIKTACEAFNKNKAKSELNELKQKTWPADINAVLDEAAIDILHSAFKKTASDIKNYLESAGAI
ncbi:MAG: ATP-binding protein [Treponema sp.]|nr:ATP-binding protein [Treponema sp.]